MRFCLGLKAVWRMRLGKTVSLKPPKMDPIGLQLSSTRLASNFDVLLSSIVVPREQAPERALRRWEIG
jgi:hypothetical protein